MILNLDYPMPLNRQYRQFRGRTIISADGRKWKAKAQAMAIQQGARLIAGAVYVSITIHPKTNKDGSASRVLVDIDSPLKALFDALNGIAYTDDSQIKMLGVCYGEAKEGGGMTVIVEAMKKSNTS